LNELGYILQHIYIFGWVYSNSRTTFGKFTVYREKFVPKIILESLISQIFSIMEMEKISGSFPYIN